LGLNKITVTRNTPRAPTALLGERTGAPLSPIFFDPLRQL